MANVNTFSWRRFDLAVGEPDHYVHRDGDVLYIGVARESDPAEPERWGACISVGDLEAEGQGATREAALEDARTDLLMSLARHWELISELFSDDGSQTR